jgi:hypothetical protein
VYGPWRYAARRGIADEFRMRTWRNEGGGNIRSSEGVYVRVYLHGGLASFPRSPWTWARLVCSL